MASGCVARGGWCPLPSLAKFSAWMNTLALAVPALSNSVGAGTRQFGRHQPGRVSAAGGGCYGLCLAGEGLSTVLRAGPV